MKYKIGKTKVTVQMTTNEFERMCSVLDLGLADIADEPESKNHLQDMRTAERVMSIPRRYDPFYAKRFRSITKD